MFPHHRFVVSVIPPLLFFLDGDLPPFHFIQEGVDHQLFFSAICWRCSEATAERFEADGMAFSVGMDRRTLDSPKDDPDAL